MLTARRLYVYFISAVSLGMTAFGLASLLSLAFARISEAFGGAVIQQSSAEIRRELSLYAAMVIVALPVWLLHWWLAERAVSRPATEGEQERASAIRTLYLSLVLGLALIFATVGSIEVIRQLIRRAFDSSVSLTGASGVWMWLAVVLVTGAGIAYHSMVRAEDTRIIEAEGPAAWLPRLYIYGAAFAGAMLVLFGAGDLITLVDDAIFGPSDVYSSARWWADPLSSAVARMLVGIVIWTVFWLWSLRISESSGWYGSSERRSSLRWFYIYAIVFVGAVATLVGVIGSLDWVIRLILSVPGDNPQVGWTREIIEPLLIAIPFAGAWAYHRLVVLDLAPADERALFAPSLRRLYTYLVAFIGLTLTALGAAWVLGILIDLLLGGSRTISVSSHVWREQVATFSAVAIVGAAAWLWHWNKAERQLQAHDAEERHSTIRRIYLYLALASTLVAVLVSLALVLYRTISAALGVQSGSGLASAVSIWLGIVVVTGILLAYHLTVLRRDLGEREPAVAASGIQRVSLVLTAPAGADIDAELDQLRHQLPDGFSLEQRQSRKMGPTLSLGDERLQRDHA